MIVKFSCVPCGNCVTLSDLSYYFPGRIGSVVIMNFKVFPLNNQFIELYELIVFALRLFVVGGLKAVTHLYFCYCF